MELLGSDAPSIFDVRRYGAICEGERRSESPATQAKLSKFLDDSQKPFLLKLELAVRVDVSVNFVKATYTLEGDGLLSLISYDKILEIREAIQLAHYPNLHAVVRETFPSNLPSQNQWLTYALGCVQPRMNYFMPMYETMVL